MHLRRLSLDQLAHLFCVFAILIALLTITSAPAAHAAETTPQPLASNQTNVAALQATQPQSIDDGLLSYWPFDEGSGTTSIDYGGSGNNSTFHSAAGCTNITPALD